MLPDNYKDIGIFKPYELCKILFNNTDQFLHMYNHLFIRHGSYIDEMYKKFTEDYNMFTSLNSRSFTRAAMANILSGLPVFFANVSEIQDYIYNSMVQCSDIAEKTACKEIIYSLMED